MSQWRHTRADGLYKVSVSLHQIQSHCTSSPSRIVTRRVRNGVDDRSTIDATDDCRLGVRSECSSGNLLPVRHEWGRYSRTNPGRWLDTIIGYQPSGSWIPFLRHTEAHFVCEYRRISLSVYYISLACHSRASTEVTNVKGTSWVCLSFGKFEGVVKKRQQYPM